MKGIIYTTGLVMLALATLTLSILIFYNNMEIKSSVSSLAVFDRIDNELAYTGNIFYDILSEYMNISVNKTNIIIEESFPETNANDLFAELDKASSFLENNSDFSLFINATKIKNEFGFLLKPSGTIISYDNGLGGNVFSVRNSSYVSAYVIRISSIGNDINVQWPENSGSDRVTIIIQSENETYSETKYMDFLSETDIDVYIDSNLFRIVVGNSTDRGMLRVENVNSVQANLKTKIEFTTRQRINFPEETFNIETVHKIKKRGYIRLG